MPTVQPHTEEDTQAMPACEETKDNAARLLLQLWMVKDFGVIVQGAVEVSEC